MTQHEQDDLLEEARLLLARYDWQLVSPDTLVQIAATLNLNTNINPTRAFVGAYCTVLHTAFIGQSGTANQSRACKELGSILELITVKKYSDLPIDERSDVAQNALERVWRARDTCREPIAFIAFAAAHLLSAVHLARRQLRRLGEPFYVVQYENDEVLDIPDPSISLISGILADEQQAELMRFFETLHQTHPRAARQIEILALRCFEKLDYPTIAERLQITVGNAYTRNSRIIATIRADPKLLQQALELGIQDLE